MESLDLKSGVFIGTSGFSYPHWGGIFYPEDLKQKDWFSYYVKYFNTVEINVSFYRLPRIEVFATWRKKADEECSFPGGFVFAIKGWRLITHVKRLKDCQAEIGKFFEAINPILNSKFKVLNLVLWQLPPSLKGEPANLADFLNQLPRGWRYAFEFRNESWGQPKTWEILRRYKSAVVFQDYKDWPIFKEVTADFVYLRFHGQKTLYSSCYTEEELKDWAKKIKDWRKRGMNVYAYFNNDALGYAVENAQKLRELVDE